MGPWTTEPARRLAWLFAAAGVLAVMGTFLVPQGGAVVGAARPWAIGFAGADLVAAAVIAVLPWDRWHARATIVAGAAALLAMVPFAALGFSSPAVHASFIVLLFVWLGAYHPPVWAFVFAVPAGVVYAVPLHVAGYDQLEDPTVVVVVPLAVLVGRTVAIATQRLHRKHRESERRARLLGVVARAAREINRLDPQQVATGLVDATLDLGFDAAVLARLVGKHLVVDQAAGLPLAPGATYPADPELAALVRGRQPVAVAHGVGEASVLAALGGGGFTGTVAAPVWAGDFVVRVLLAADRGHGACEPARVDAVGLLAAQAGQALTLVRTFEAERHERRRQTDAAHRDHLTGLGNRRAAMRMLGRLAPGDAVVLLDLDRFKAVNDTHGHATGDDVLRGLAAYLREVCRDSDSVARFGGEEFLLVLADAETAAPAIVDRVLQGWRDRKPVTTLSAGIAVHQQGHDPQRTLANADNALYEAKATGRNRAATAEPSLSQA